MLNELQQYMNATVTLELMVCPGRIKHNCPTFVAKNKMCYLGMKVKDVANQTVQTSVFRVVPFLIKQ
jgi:hypothetical protein